MLIVLVLCLLAASWVTGSGILCILYGKKGREAFFCADALLTGWAAVVGAAETAHILSLFGHLSLRVCVLLFSGLMIFLVLAMAAAGAVSWRKGAMPKRERQEGSCDVRAAAFLVPIAFILLQAAFFLDAGGAYLKGDMTLETVVSFLDTDGIYQVNPLTGAPYEAGIPSRLKILCLPTFYSILCRIFSLKPQEVVWRAIPCVTLACSCGAYYCVGKTLFPESRKRQICFLTAAALLVWAGSCAPGMDGFGVLYGGWRGVTVRNMALVPYLVSLCLRRKWKPVFLCIAAEACLAWTLYGAGVCVFVAAGLWLSRYVCDRLEARAEGGRQNG